MEQLQAAERDAAAAAAAAAAERERLAGELGAVRVLAAARGRAAEGLQSQLDQVRSSAQRRKERAQRRVTRPKKCKVLVWGLLMEEMGQVVRDGSFVIKYTKSV